MAYFVLLSYNEKDTIISYNPEFINVKYALTHYIYKYKTVIICFFSSRKLVFNVMYYSLVWREYTKSVQNEYLSQICIITLSEHMQ